ncbi:tonB-dependent Receptor Plug domain protein [Asticcacaulis biprosthecium C19]|uniref:TonB-dependent Receptor Plug domain protein n=1 Tax=Asticcacaulis biprosthecium C19 TaxID=715226 RepID=F4QJA0_9CAUL|nr:TonB-dependent receptor [Asticcacaulis biprosthecium]EGF91931.1 tonB-dependent Receptor Plug domain protein [Asticcacaulis biprosthecium C19]
MRKFTSLLTAAVAALPFIAGAAGAQSIDYGSLQDLFGEPVTTSATGSPQRSTEVPVDMTIISAEDIKRSGAHDLQTLISRVPGIDVLNWSTYGADVGVRGYNQAMSPRLLVLVNGRQVYLDHYGYTAWQTIPVQLSEIRQIEVVKGPNSALFGFNAVSGVVNIITYNPKYDTVSGGSVSAGSRNRAEASLVQTFRLSPKIAARLSAGASKADEWDNSFGAPSYRPEASRANVNLDTVISLTEKTELRFETSWSNTQSNDAVSNYDMSETKYRTGSVKLDLTSDTPVGLVTATAYRNTLKSNTNVAGPVPLDNTISVVSLQDLFKRGKHTFRFGVEFRQNEMPTTPLTGGEVSYTVMAPSAMWNWAISDTLSTAVAIRSDNVKLKRTGSFPAGFPMADNANWDRDISELSYNAGAVWRISDKDTLRVMTAKGVQAPTLIELGGFQLISGPIAVMGNPTIEPTIVKNSEISYDRTFTSVKLGVKLFTQTSDNVKGQPSSTAFYQYPTLTTYPALSWLNVADSEMTGFELSASGKLGEAFHWSADYTATDIEDEAYPTRNLTELRAAFGRMSPESRANLNVGWSGSKWTIDAYLHHTDDFDTFAPETYAVTTIPAHLTLAANVNYTLTDSMTVSLSGQNLGNAKIQTAAYRVPSTVFLSLTKRW